MESLYNKEVVNTFFIEIVIRFSEKGGQSYADINLYNWNDFISAINLLCIHSHGRR